MSHKLKDENNNIECPVLKQFTCPKCGEVGKHTVSYCPMGKKGLRESKERSFNEQQATQNRRAANKSHQANNRPPRPRRAIGLRGRAQNWNGQQQEPVEQQVKIKEQLDDGQKLVRAIQPIASMELGIEQDMKLMSLLDTELQLNTLRNAHIIFLMSCNPARFELVKAAALLAHEIINSLY